MLELKTEIPETGMQLRIDADRPFESRTGDGTLRIMGQGGDGSITVDSTWVETSPREAHLIAMWLRSVETPPSELQEEMTQEIAATFGSRLSGRDAHQIAELCTRTIEYFLKDRHDESVTLTGLAERFERASSRSTHQPLSGDESESGEKRSGKRF